jgi:hypothetical protein
MQATCAYNCPMRIIVLVAALGLSAACESGSSDGGNAPELSAPAGKVVDIEGTVRARPEQGEARALALGDEVRGSDIIETGPEGSVRIELYHNNAQWSLGPDKQRQVSESEAWRLPAQPRQPLLTRTDDTDPTAAAGRQAERHAADTLATARAAVPEEPVDMPDRAPSAAADETLDVAAGKAASTPVQRRITGDQRASQKKGDSKQDSSMKESRAADTSTVEPELRAEKAPVAEATGGAAAALDHGPPSSASAKAAPRSVPAPESSASLAPASPTIELGTTKVGDDADAAALRAIRRAIQKQLPRVRQCLGTHKPAERSVVVTFVITAEGRASSIESPARDEVLRGCLGKHLRSLTITGVPAGTKVEQTLLLADF